MEIWCYMVFLGLYWDIGFSGKLKSKNFKPYKFGYIWKFSVICSLLPFYYSKRHLIQKDSKIFIV